MRIEAAELKTHDRRCWWDCLTESMRLLVLDAGGATSSQRGCSCCQRLEALVANGADSSVQESGATVLPTVWRPMRKQRSADQRGTQTHGALVCPDPSNNVSNPALDVQTLSRTRRPNSVSNVGSRLVRGDLCRKGGSNPVRAKIEGAERPREVWQCQDSPPLQLLGGWRSMHAAVLGS